MVLASAFIYCTNPVLAVPSKKKFLNIVDEEGEKIFQENFPVFKAQGYIKNLQFDLIRKKGTSFPVILNRAEREAEE